MTYNYSYVGCQVSVAAGAFVGLNRRRGSIGRGESRRCLATYCHKYTVHSSSQSSRLDTASELIGIMASRQSQTRHFSVPADDVSKPRAYECQQKVWSSDLRDERRRSSSSQRRYIDVVATAAEVQGLLPPRTVDVDTRGSDDYPTNTRLHGDITAPANR